MNLVPLNFAKATVVALFVFTTAAHTRPALGAESKTHAHPNHLSGFVGYTNATGDKEGVKFGSEYEYRFAERFGVGGTVDYNAGDIEALVVSGGMTFYPIPSSGLWTALAIGGKFKTKKDKFLVRVVGGYDFHIGHGGWSIGPTVFWDITTDGHDSVAIGVQFGKGF